MDAREPAPRLGGGRLRLAVQHRLELLRGELGLAGLDEALAESFAHVDEELDVERGVLQPGLGERAGRPVGRRVLLRELDVEQLLDDRGEADARHPEQSGGELGVEDALGVEADLAQAREVLARGVQYPLVAVDGVLER